MHKTLAKIGEHLRANVPHTFTPGRRVNWLLPDKLNEGIEMAVVELDTDLQADLFDVREVLAEAIEPEDLEA